MMFDYRQLEVGDYVSCLMDYSVRRVTGVEERNEGVVSVVGGILASDRIAPLILCVQNLIDNDFKMVNGVYVYLPQGVDVGRQYVECHCRRNGEVRMIEIANFDRSFKIDRSEHIYVHEFQNALRLCGYVDFADGMIVESI